MHYLLKKLPDGVFGSEQNGHQFADNIFKCIFIHAKLCILIQISLKFVTDGSINDKLSLVQVMAQPQTGDKHHLTQYWWGFVTPCGVIRSKWVWYESVHLLAQWWPCLSGIYIYMYGLYIGALVQERRNSSALAMGLRLSCTNPSIWYNIRSKFYSYVDFSSMLCNIYFHIIFHLRAPLYMWGYHATDICKYMEISESNI